MLATTALAAQLAASPLALTIDCETGTIAAEPAFVLAMGGNMDSEGGPE